MKILFAILGLIFVGIGILGIILPGMPGTVFLLIALFCFTKSSDRLHNWFVQSSIYQKHLKEFHDKKALSKKAKARILFISTLAMGAGFVLSEPVWVKIVIAISLVVQYSVFFWVIPNLEEKPTSPPLSD